MAFSSFLLFNKVSACYHYFLFFRVFSFFGVHQLYLLFYLIHSLPQNTLCLNCLSLAYCSTLFASFFYPFPIAPPASF